MTFHNPYGFIPIVRPQGEGNVPADAAPVPADAAPVPADAAPVPADVAPVSAERYHEAPLSGRLRINLETVTPVLVPDSSTESTDVGGHKTFDSRSDGDRPVLDTTQVRGSLRTVYEAITGSRFPFSRGYDRRLAMRADAPFGKRVVPVRIDWTAQEEGRVTWTCELLPGKSRISHEGPANGHPMYAAWVRIDLKGAHNNPDDTDPPLRPIIGNVGGINTGEKVFFTMEKLDHHQRQPRPTRTLQGDFSFYNVTSIREAEGALDAGEQLGWLYKTGMNALNKHDERVFFGGDIPAAIADGALMRFCDLLADYALLHGEDPGTNPLAPDWSPIVGNARWRKAALRWNERRVQGRNVGDADVLRVLAASPHSRKNGSEGSTLAYALVDVDGGKYIVRDFVPVTITRVLATGSPGDLLAVQNATPAVSLGELSTADRVFGWVAPSADDRGGSSAHRSQVRFGAVRWSEEARLVDVEGADGGLAILGSPKPAHVRFYLTDAAEGRPTFRTVDQRRGAFDPGNGRLRGRKVYRHHDPFDKRNEVEEQAAWKAGAQSNQNRTITRMIPVGAKATLDIRFENLFAKELGALCWMLDPENVPHYRIGYGRPLGFGSIRLSIDKAESQILTCADLRDRYRAPYDEADGAKRSRSIGDCIKLFEHAYGSVLGAVKPALTAILGAQAHPVHYPRLNSQEIPTKGYEWFVANATGRAPGDNGHVQWQGHPGHHALPTDPNQGLPYQPYNPQ